jgi:hypothetical protein
MSNPENRYNQQANMVTLEPTKQPITVRQMSASESSVLQQYAAQPIIVVEGALQAQEGATEKTSGMDRSMSFLLRLIPLAILWAIMGAVAAFVLYGLIELDEATSAAIGFTVFVFLSYRSYDNADKNERYDSRNGVEHHRIDVAENLTLKKLDHDQELKRMALEATIRQLEARNGNDY